MFAGAWDAHLACYSALLLRNCQHSWVEAMPDIWQKLTGLKDLMKNLTTRAWTATTIAHSQPVERQLQQSKLHALRVQAAMAAYSLLDGDRSFPFTKGTACLIQTVTSAECLPPKQSDCDAWLDVLWQAQRWPEPWKTQMNMCEPQPRASPQCTWRAQCAAMLRLHQPQQQPWTPSQVPVIHFICSH